MSGETPSTNPAQYMQHLLEYNSDAYRQGHFRMPPEDRTPNVRAIIGLPHTDYIQGLGVRHTVNSTAGLVVKGLSGNHGVGTKNKP